MKSPALPLCLLLLSSACQSTAPTATPAAPDRPAPTGYAHITNEVAATAEVVAVEPTTRVVTLRREDGSQFRVRCGPEVRNFAQIAAGDVLRVKYTETLAAKRLSAEEKSTPAEASFAAARAKAGATPAAGTGVAIDVCVKIESIDREREVVVFSLSSGELFARKVATSEGREFVKTLKPGDRVRLEYTEILALSVEKL
jgi:hypothetical protein